MNSGSLVPRIRVLHGLEDIAGQPGHLARALRAAGIFAESWVLARHPFGYRSDRVLYESGMPRGNAARLSRTRLLLEAICRFNVWHLHRGSSFYHLSKDLPIARLLGIKIVLHYRGSEVRPVIGMEELDPFTESKLLRQMRYADLVFVHDGELAELIKPIWPTPLVCPNVLDLRFVAPQCRQPLRAPGKLRVVHAPSDPEKKGTHHVREAVSRLSGAIDYVELSKTTHDKIITAYTDADLVIDQMLIGTYGNASLEAMALGKPVVCYLNPKWSHYVSHDLPIIPCSPHNLFEVLQRAVNDRDWLKAVGERGLNYVGRYHTPDAVARFLIPHYRALFVSRPEARGVSLTGPSVNLSPGTPMCSADLRCRAMGDATNRDHGNEAPADRLLRQIAFACSREDDFVLSFLGLASVFLGVQFVPCDAASVPASLPTISYGVNVDQGRLFCIPQLASYTRNTIPVVRSPFNGLGEVTDTFPFDLPKAVRFWLADEPHREPSAGELDRHGRIRPECTLINQLGLAEHPVVNGYLLLFKHWIEKRLGTSTPGHLPPGRKCIVVLSHDVDDPVDPGDLGHSLWKIWWCGTHGFLKNIPKEAVRFLKRLKHRREYTGDRHWLFEDIIQEEAKRGFKSTFFFAAIRNPRDRHGCDVLYDIRAPGFQNVFRLLRQRGIEVALHGSYGSSADDLRFSSELAHLQDCSAAQVKGNRQHCWQLGNAWWSTFEALAAAGIAYDSSVGFNDIPGFRRGIAFPFIPVSPHSGKALGIMELPVMLMDGALFYREDLRAEDVQRRFKTLLSRLKDYQGVGVVNWHSHTAFPGSQQYRRWGEGYLTVLSILAEDLEVQVMSCGEVYEYYRRKYQASTVVVPRPVSRTEQIPFVRPSRPTSAVRVLMVGAASRDGDMAPFIARHFDSLRANGIEISTLPCRNSPGRLWTRARMMLWQHGPPSLVAREVREAFIKADLVHFQWPGHLIAWLPVARRFKKPILVSLRGRQINVVPHVPGQYCYVRQLREALPLCDAYHCVSEHIRNAAEQYGLVPSRARVIRPAVDTTFFTPGNSLDSYGAIRIVMVGSLIWLKGYEYALMALCKVVQSGLDVGLTIVGEGPDEDRILRTAEDLGIHSHVALRTRLSPAEIRQLLQDHHIFLHASLSEGLANVVLEAMACGLPVVSTDVGGMPEAIDDSVEGYLVPSRAADAMADRLMKLAMRPDIRMAMGQKARARAVRDFDLKDQGRKFVELYQEVLSQHENRVS